MKTKVVIAALVLMIGVAQANASEHGPSLTISHQDGSSIFLVNYLGSQTGETKMTIKDNLGRVLIKKSLKGVKGFLLPVNLESVDEGIYTLEIDNGTDKQIKTLNYSIQTPATYAHAARLGDKRYLLSVAHAGTEKVSIRILDNAGTPVFEEEQLVEGGFAKVYDLKNLAGAPSFEVTDLSGRSITIQ